MPRTDNDIRVRPSVLDRLLDKEPAVSTESARARGQSLWELKRSVQRDLKALLNTRRSSPGKTSARRRHRGDEELSQELQASVLCYGLPDFSAANKFSEVDQKRIRQALEDAIEKFEPRLLEPKVKLLPLDKDERVLRFRIEAHLRCELAPQPVTFDTVLHLHNGEYRIEAH